MKRNITSIRKNNAVLSFHTVRHTMPPKLKLLTVNTSPMKRRTCNKDQHPGAAVAPKSCCSDAEMVAVCEKEAKKIQADQEAKWKAIKHVAELEDALHNEDILWEHSSYIDPNSKDKMQYKQNKKWKAGMHRGQVESDAMCE